MISSDYTTIIWAVLTADLKWVHHDIERILVILQNGIFKTMTVGYHLFN